MAVCVYCGESAGFFKKAHPKCEEIFKEGKALIEGELNTMFTALSEEDALAMTQNLVSSDPSKDDGHAVRPSLFMKIMKIAADHNIDPLVGVKALIIGEYEKAVERFLDEGAISPEKKERLNLFMAYFIQDNLVTREDFDRNGAYTKLIQSEVLEKILSGELPDNIKVTGTLPINLQKGEKIIYFFPSTKYLEDKTKRKYVGGTQGVSIRVMKGVYYRVGGFKGEPVEHDERVVIDDGTVFVTDKNLYFYGPKKSFRVPYSKIVSFLPFSDGIGFVKDNDSAKPQIFQVGDGWFAYNLITNMASFEEKA